jgi:hypothetical protein
MCQLCAGILWQHGRREYNSRLTVDQTSTGARFIYRVICVPHACWQIVGLQTQRSDPGLQQRFQLIPVSGPIVLPRSW